MRSSPSHCRRGSIQHQSTRQTTECSASECRCRPPVLGGGHGHCRRASASCYVRRPSESPAWCVVHARTRPPRRRRLRSSSMERLSPASSTSTFRSLPPSPSFPGLPTLAQYIMHEHASIADHNARRAAVKEINADVARIRELFHHCSILKKQNEVRRW